MLTPHPCSIALFYDSAVYRSIVYVFSIPCRNFPIFPNLKLGSSGAQTRIS